MASFGFYLLKKIGIIFILFFIGLSCYGVYVLYDKVYISEWTEEQKQEYLNSKQVSAELNRDRFEEVVGKIKAREEYAQKDLGDIKDIFK